MWTTPSYCAVDCQLFVQGIWVEGKSIVQGKGALGCFCAVSRKFLAQYEAEIHWHTW